MVTTPVSYTHATDMAPAFAGMIADAMFTDKVSVPCGAAAQPFGTVVAYVEATGASVLPAGANPIAGVAIHEQQTGSRRNQTTGYVQYESMSVMRRGRIWGLASGACVKGANATFDPATGMFTPAGTPTALPNAKFLSAPVTVGAVEPGGPTQSIVLIELHSPAV